jgi:hypothetical protein
LESCLDIDRPFSLFWPPLPVFGVLSHGRRQTVRRLWPPEFRFSILFLHHYLLVVAFEILGDEKLVYTLKTHQPCDSS